MTRIFGKAGTSGSAAGSANVTPMRQKQPGERRSISISTGAGPVQAGGTVVVRSTDQEIAAWQARMDTVCSYGQNDHRAAPAAREFIAMCMGARGTTAQQRDAFRSLATQFANARAAQGEFAVAADLFKVAAIFSSAPRHMDHQLGELCKTIIRSAPLAFFEDSVAVEHVLSHSNKKLRTELIDACRARGALEGEVGERLARLANQAEAVLSLMDSESDCDTDASDTEPDRSPLALMEPLPLRAKPIDGGRSS